MYSFLTTALSNHCLRSITYVGILNLLPQDTLMTALIASSILSRSKTQAFMVAGTKRSIACTGPAMILLPKFLSGWR
jgi:hypothetical protein